MGIFSSIYEGQCRERSAKTTRLCKSSVTWNLLCLCTGRQRVKRQNVESQEKWNFYRIWRKAGSLVRKILINTTDQSSLNGLCPNVQSSSGIHCECLCVFRCLGAWESPCSILSLLKYLMFAESTRIELRTMPLLAARLDTGRAMSKSGLTVPPFCCYKHKGKRRIRKRKIVTFLMTASCVAHRLSGQPSGKKNLGELFYIEERRRAELLIRDSLHIVL